MVGRRQEDFLIFTNAKRVWRQDTLGDYWVFDRKTIAFTSWVGVQNQRR